MTFLDGRRKTIVIGSSLISRVNTRSSTMLSKFFSVTPKLEIDQAVAAARGYSQGGLCHWVLKVRLRSEVMLVGTVSARVRVRARVRFDAAKA